MADTVTFQGGGQYDAKGQEIHYIVRADKILFFDASRGIDGSVPALTGQAAERASARDHEEWLMFHYLRGQYGSLDSEESALFSA